MKRMSLMIDEELLAQCVREFEAESNSEAVSAAITEVLRVREVRKIPDYFGKVGWEGDLSDMREDDPAGATSGQVEKE